VNDVARAQEITLRGLFARAAKLFAGNVAVVDAAGRYTYAEIDRRARRLAAVFRARGLGRGDRVAILSETRREYVETYIAAAYAGVTLLTLNIRLHPRELGEVLDAAKPKLVMASRDLWPKIEASVGAVKHALGLEESLRGEASYEDALAAAGDPDEPAARAALAAIEVRAADICNVLYTSGTTGRPKGAMISHGAAATRGHRLAQWFRLTRDDGFIGWCPMFHCAGDESLYATYWTGGRYAVFPKVDHVEMFTRIQSDRLSWTLLLPGVLTDFLDHPRRGEFDLSSFRFAIGYANMMPQVITRLTKELDLSFFDAFGQTETSYLLAHVEVLPGEVPTLRKLPSPLMDVRLVDGDMNEVPIGTPGECVVRGPSVMSGYLDDPEATAAAFRGGWLHTGDVLVQNEDGTLTFTDRSKYLIKTGGENVYPAEVEQVIARHPAVQESCVLGVPDAYYGETIKAVIVLRPGAQLTAEEITLHCRAHLASYKRPRYVQFVSAAEIPRSTTGKILRHDLAARGALPDERVDA
jgi:acyl-CoA synthetase (AMP-forming)/AMP-acid ligase II